MNEFEKQVHDMFDHIWDCEIDHPVFQDTVGDLMSAVIQAYNNSTQPEQHWIPCSKGLPKKDGRYQVTRYDDVTNTEFIDILWYEENLWWNRRSTGDYAVTAWMPLPKPYGEVRLKNMGEVFDRYTDTVGNYHFTDTETGHHVVSNESAIKELKWMLTDNSNTGDMYDALKMAIEALESLPNTFNTLECVKLDNNSTKVVNENDELVRKMDDLKVTERKIIYLDDAIDVIDNHQFSIEYCKEHNIDRAIDVSMARIALEDLPSAQPEQRWIPVSERLPKEGTDVLLAYEKNMVVGNWEDICGDVTWYANSGDGWFTPTESIDNDGIPIAWMPLPEPYRGEKHVND